MKDNTVRSLERGLAVLQCFDLNTEELSLSQIAEQLSLPPTTTLRLASALTQMGFLQKSRAKTYFLGNKVYLLGAVARKHFKLRRIILPIMESLRDDVQEGVTLYALEHGHRVCYEHVESLQSMRFVVRIGDRFPLWAGAAGKCLLAFADKNLVEDQLARAKPLTSTTITEKERFLEELARIRETGEAVSHGEREEGVTAVAIPIFSAKKDVDYVLAVAAPSSRLGPDSIKGVIRRTREAALAIAGQLYN